MIDITNELSDTKISLKEEIMDEITEKLTEKKLKQYMTTKPPLQKILKGILHIEDENKHNHERTVSFKPHENRQHSESTIELAVYTQILK
jgi:NADPH:quinone reductase-like Zn-dependent oxidoreductase